MIDFIRLAFDFVLHLDRHLGDLIGQYGTGTYLILTLIVFCETGLVIMPFLPGDSLLFAAGAFAGLGRLDPWILCACLMGAAILGDNLNYWIGRGTRHSALGARRSALVGRFIKQAYLERTQGFFDRYGGRTVIIARFVPIVRTFTPFVAGVGAMPYSRFLAYSIAGGALWVFGFIWLGYFFGNLPIVRNNFGMVIGAIILISVLPMVVEVVRARRRSSEPT